VVGFVSIHLLEVGIVWPPEPFILSKLERLAARGFRVTVVANMLEGGDRVEPPGIDVVALRRNARKPKLVAETVTGLARLAVRSPRRAWRLVAGIYRPVIPPRARSFWKDLGRLCTFLPVAGLSPDVVHFEWETAAVAYHALVGVWGCPVVVSCRGSGVSVYPHLSALAHHARGYPVVFEHCSAVHCVSEATRRTAVGLGVDPAKTSVIKPAVDSSRFKPSRWDREVDILRVISVGELRWPKGHEYALHAVRLALDAGVPVAFEVIGGEAPPITGVPSERPRLRYAIDDLGLNGRAVLHGATDHEQVVAALAEADVFLHLSLSEGLPNVVLEAMACSVPVVVSDVGGVREAVRHGVDGLLVPPRDPRAAAAALARLWRDRDLRRRMGEAGRKRVEAEFTVAQQIELWARLYEGVAA
jgi:colanic acid/amylovoran biosynthesis glycosyltransferase